VQSESADAIIAAYRSAAVMHACASAPAGLFDGRSIVVSNSPGYGAQQIVAGLRAVRYVEPSLSLGFVEQSILSASR
jgi:hypothetical protein